MINRHRVGAVGFGTMVIVGVALAIGALAETMLVVIPPVLAVTALSFLSFVYILSIDHQSEEDIANDGTTLEILAVIVCHYPALIVSPVLDKAYDGWQWIMKKIGAPMYDSTSSILRVTAQRVAGVSTDSSTNTNRHAQKSTYTTGGGTAGMEDESIRYTCPVCGDEGDDYAVSYANWYICADCKPITDALIVQAASFDRTIEVDM